ncbi:MAG: hypothetical protein COX79_02155 [Candidatus Levybacteria bacterium CG_4_10_14_0_2_um_filter_36_16]|nr:MAG: hypothetical protein AUK12_02420 [Candidatus Levybacteria bacterium CG2_30_37_29]PIZ97531.1 MAG: hypothetical protein COX79_02155 [Candidatus Levybacteria bacterium CG_4_10_14_0_2_um_filter_36_16]
MAKQDKTTISSRPPPNRRTSLRNAQKGKNLPTENELLELLHVAQSRHNHFVQAQNAAKPFIESENAAHEHNLAEIETRLKVDISNEQRRLSTFWHQTAAWGRRRLAVSEETRRHERVIRLIHETYVQGSETAMRRSKTMVHNLVEQMIVEDSGDPLLGFIIETGSGPGSKSMKPH